MTTGTCQYRKKPGGPATCVAMADPRSLRGLCAGHRAAERKAIATEWRSRTGNGGRATADTWAWHEGWDPAELAREPVPDSEPQQTGIMGRKRGRTR